MRKMFISALLAGILAVTAGCTPTGQPEEIDSSVPDISSTTEPQTESSLPESSQAENPGTQDEPVEPVAPDTDRLGDAVKDAYTGLEIDAFIRERKAILPGFAIPVTVVVKNTGDETVDYIHGSGSYKIPEAVFISVDGMQAVQPEDHLGMVTMDFRTSELKPGEQLEFDLYVMAIEPNDNFKQYSFDMYMDGEYIADVDYETLHAEYPDLVAVEPGTYQAQAYFLYYTRGDSGTNTFTTAPNGYAEFDFQISVG